MSCSLGCAPAERFGRRLRGQTGAVFFFFTNRLGCLGSLLVSLLLTAVLFVLFTVL